MAPRELNFFSLQFLITGLYLVQMLMFDGKKELQIPVNPFSHVPFHKIKVIDCLVLPGYTPILILLFLLLPSVFIKKNYLDD